MNKMLVKLMAFGAAIALAFSLSACGASASSSGSQGATGSGSSAPAEGASEDIGSLDPAVRAEIEQILADARAKEYGTVTFSTETRTTAIGTEEGKTVSQTVLTTMNGELNRDKKNPSMHFAYEAQSSAQPVKTAYDMYINNDGVYVVQNGDLYLTDSKDATPESYISSVADVASEKEVTALLDVARGYKVERGDDTSITITADVSKLGEAGLVDVSSLPENTSIATMVANYVVGNDGHLKKVRLMSSTTGSPTYRVYQAYDFSKYDDTKMPEWPNLADQAAKDPRIKTDADGTMYIIDDDGVKYIIESIDPDGTVHAHADEQSVPQGETIMVYDNPTRTTTTTTKKTSSSGKSSKSGDAASPQLTEGDATQGSIDDPVFTEGDATATRDTTTSSSGSANTSTSGTSASSSNGSSTTTSNGATSNTTAGGNAGSTTEETTTTQGRAYITAGDGTIHYLDEPGSEIRNIGGTRVFIDANGEWYFLNE